MKQTITLLLVLLMSSGLEAQSTFEKSYQLNKEDKLTLDFEYPELVKINTWEKQEVLVKARVFINGKENTEDFTIEDKRGSKGLIISSHLKDIDKHNGNYIMVSDDDDDEESITVNRDGKSITIGKGNGNYTYGTKIDIELEITLPKSAVVQVNAKYGMVEVQSLPKEIEVLAKFGGADIKVIERNIKDLNVSTSWGQIFANLDSKLSVKGNDMMGKQMIAELKENGGSESLRVESEFGNIFLRKN
ncbi:MAG: hypothetical protein HWE21_12625 [Cytophagia bacterium]|nr:hypothetical protein [Cytophagia bacterium]